VFKRFLAEIRPPRPGGDRDINRAVVGANPEAAVAEVGDRADVRAVVILPAEEFKRCLCELLAAVGDLQLVGLSGGEKAVKMFLPPEDSGAAVGVVGAGTLEDPCPVVEGP